MVLEDIQGKKFPGYGRCIYCGCSGEKHGLGNEHIIPYSLGGNAEIENASCKRCESTTSYLDGYLARHIYNEYRSHAGVQSREPKKRPKSFPAKIVVDGQKEVRQLPTVDHPYFLALPIWGRPGLLTGALPVDVFPVQKAHIFEYIPENLRDTLRLSEAQSL
jgi:HNH endonuclease